MVCHSIEMEKTILCELNKHGWLYNNRRQRNYQHYGPQLDSQYRIVSSRECWTSLPHNCKKLSQNITSFWNSLGLFDGNYIYWI